jgi:tetratricopeptide (TPR) repeat protein
VRPAALFFTAFVGFALLAPSAGALPTIWERARKPNARSEARLLAALERTLDARSQASSDPLIAENLARAAVAMSDLSGISEPEDPRLACLMAKALLASGHARAGDARRLLEAALPRLPEGLLAAEAWYSLGLANSVLDEPLRARVAYTRAIELSWDSELRAGSFYNRGEENMRLGELDLAISDYRRAILLGREPDALALAHFGLGVALERSSDLPAAYQELDRALAVTLPVPPFPTEDPLELPGVFFVPAYERHYLDALVNMARARHTSGSVQKDLYGRAVSAWDAYLGAASESERWYDHARAHRERCKNESEGTQSERRAGRARR